MRILLPLLAVGALVGACTTTRADGAPQVQTAAEANRESLQGAVKAPLRDLNVLRTKVPPILLESLADPYARPRTSGCAGLIAAILPLEEALGPDYDLRRGEEGFGAQGRSAALGMVAGFASDAIPFRSWVRRLTGAESRDNLVQDAITAGGVRRAYLKGLGEAKGCKPPATPSHELAGSEVPTADPKPLFPTRAPPAPERQPARRPTYPTR